MMSSMMVMPRKCHLKRSLHIFTYLKQKYNSEMVLDPTVPEFDEALFQQDDWRYTLYFEAKEAISSNAEEARGLGLKINDNVDSNHVGDEITRRSRTGYIIRLNYSPIYFCTKK